MTHDTARPLRALGLVYALTLLLPAAATLLAGGHAPALAEARDRAAREYADLSYPLNVNEATQAELAAIDGLSERQAAAIVAYRETVGVIPDLRMLCNIKGIGPKTFERLEKNVFVSFKDEPIRHGPVDSCGGRIQGTPTDRVSNGGDETAPGDGIAKKDLNAAGLADFTAIRGIGEKTAQAIVEQRDRQGGYRTFEELGRVRGIGPKRVEALKARFCLAQ